MNEIELDVERFQALRNGGSVRLDRVDFGSICESSPVYGWGEKVIVTNGTERTEAMILDRHHSKTGSTYTYIIGPCTDR